MDRKTIKEIVKIFNNNFKNNNINVIFNGSLELIMKISNFKYYVSQDNIILSSGKREMLKMETYYIDEVIIKNNCVKFIFDSDFTVAIDC